MCDTLCPKPSFSLLFDIPPFQGLKLCAAVSSLEHSAVNPSNQVSNRATNGIKRQTNLFRSSSVALSGVDWNCSPTVIKRERGEGVGRRSEIN